ncbi:MAG: tRNA dihydrouridine synthase DusB [Nitratireductor sp.]|nr:tRNA dihydrouridine synthase DusB [Nitratireductor sp.]
MTQENPGTDIQALHQPMRLGGLELRNRVFLAPMSGITDVPFRQIAWRFGAGFCVSEMVASEALVTGQMEMVLKSTSSGLPLHAVQIAGREPQWMALAAKMACDNGAQLIDINMGCPAKRVTTGYSGSALMRDLDHAMTLVDAVIDAVDVPVTLKMRLGWDDNTINAPELARRAVDAGIQLVTVHGRTRCQFYKGTADWARVRPVKKAISVPLVVNGDISCVQTAQAAMAQSGADAVMVGRASYGAPWLPGLLSGTASAEAMQMPANELVSEHYEAMLSFYGTILGLKQARKHLGWYLTTLYCDVSPKLRMEMMTATRPAEVLELISRVFSSKPIAEAIITTNAINIRSREKSGLAA